MKNKIMKSKIKNILKEIIELLKLITPFAMLFFSFILSPPDIEGNLESTPESSIQNILTAEKNRTETENEILSQLMETPYEDLMKMKSEINKNKNKSGSEEFMLSAIDYSVFKQNESNWNDKHPILTYQLISITLAVLSLVGFIIVVGSRY